MAKRLDLYQNNLYYYFIIYAASRVDAAKQFKLADCRLPCLARWRQSWFRRAVEGKVPHKFAGRQVVPTLDLVK
jgi:hypothetical protein